MSQLEVDKIIPQSGTTLTIGDSGDTITFADGATLAIDTNTLAIDSTNNRVGIGTSSPSDSMEISQSNNTGGTLGLRVHNTNTGTAGNYAGIYATAVNGLIGMRANAVQTTSLSARVQLGSTTAHPVSFVTSDTERMRIDSSGNVGIGTSSPDADLTISSGGGEMIHLISSHTNKSWVEAEAGNGSMWRLGTVDSNPHVRLEAMAVTGEIKFLTGGSNERMRIDDSGNVGIGTSSPTSTLSVKTSAGTLNVEPLGAGAVQLASPTSLGFNIGSGYNYEFDVNGTEAMRIDNNRNVGIGTTSPSSMNAGANQLVVGNGSTGQGLTIYSSTTTAGSIHFADGTSGDTAYRGQLVYNHNGDYMAMYTAASQAMRIDSSGRVGIGVIPNTAVTTGGLHVHGTGNPVIRITNSVTGTGTTDGLIVGNSGGDTSDFQISNYENGFLGFGTNGTERMRIDSSGDLFIGKTSVNFSVAGIRLNVSNQKYSQFTRDDGGVIDINRLTSDGELVAYHQDGTKEGNISVSGTTVSYNGFTGTHWSRLSNNSKPTILKGTILESLDEMMDWYQVQFDITETDDDGNETTRTEKQSYALGDGESVGDVITYTYEETDYQATIIQEGDVKHTKSKISDTVDAKNVYGVFVAWDNDDDTVNDMYVAQTGTFVVRLNSSVTTLNKGDLIQSNGDGTGKVQADDIIRSSTVAKVLSTTKIETYDDGSYIVPCSLHC